MTEDKDEQANPSEKLVELRDRILAERDKGNILYWEPYGGTIALIAVSLDEFVKQPADGILYDLNRLEEVVLTFIHDPKWVNDFAVAMTIRKLVAQRDKWKLCALDLQRAIDMGPA